MINNSLKLILKEKGFSFSFDALISVFLFMILLTFLFTTQTDSSSNIIISKQIADDLIISSIKLNQVQDFNQTKIESFFSQNLPPQYNYSIKINSYILNSGFSLENEFSFGENNIPNEFIESRKIFLNFNNQEIENYNEIKLRLWIN